LRADSRSLLWPPISLKQLPMHSINLGFEVQREKVLFYCEYQVGLIWAGASVSPVLE